MSQGWKTPLAGRPLIDFLSMPPDGRATLLGNRFLCRQGGMLMVGPSGMGKSSASVQQDVLWSIGRPAFGIAPRGALKILTIQAEDDDGDIYEMISGVAAYLNLTAEERAMLKQNCIYISHKALTGIEFIHEVAKPALEFHSPDLLRLNPLQAYLGGDITRPDVTSLFLRSGLNPLLETSNSGSIVVHHTPKTNFRDTEKWKASDWMYAGAGSADITNWARAILIIDPTDDSDVFRFIAAKRGKRIGWADEEGLKTAIRYFSHSPNGAMHWEDTEESDITGAGAKKKGGSEIRYTEQDILGRMSLIDAKHTTEIKRDVCSMCGMSNGTFYALWNKLRADGKIIESDAGWRKIL